MNTTVANDLSARKRELLMLRLKRTAVAQSRPQAPPAIGAADRRQVLPLSFAQQRLWFLDQLDHSAGAAYHMPAALRLSGALDKAALRAALERMVARHESLRTTFACVDGEPSQRIGAADCGFDLREADLGQLEGEAQQAEVIRISSEEVKRLFDLAAGPLIRGQLLRLGEREHVLLLTQHHIISDGWSIGVLVSEVSALYQAFVQGQPDPLPALAIQYADYAAWQRAWLQGEVLQAQIAFWTGHLAGAPALLELPTDRPRPAVQSHAGSTAQFSLSPALSDGVRALSQRHGVTLFMTMLAAWATLLSRLSGQGDVVVGTAVANRQRTEIEALIGFFVNTLALRVRLDDNPTVAGLLEQVRNSTLAAYEHQDLPFEQVVDALQPERSMSYSPLFQTMISMNDTPSGGALALPGLSIAGIEQEKTTSQFDLSLALTDAGTHIVAGFSYAVGLFDSATIERMFGQFERLVGAMVADDTQRIGSLALLGEAERHQVLRGFNDTDTNYAQGELLHGLFEARALAQPDAPALVCEDETLSYDELNFRANQLARHLLALGVKPDDRVAICVERSVDMVVGLFGILKAGAGYVPLDPGYPVDRLAFMLADCAPAVLLTQQALAAVLPAPGVPVVVLDGADAPLIAWRDGSNPDVAGLSGASLAYVIYTSGSTGMPKGVMNEHHAVANRLHWMQERFALDAHDRVLQKTPFSFDVSVWEFFWPLLAGAAIVLAKPEGHKSPEYLRQLIDRSGVTTLHFVPSMLQAFMEQAQLWRNTSIRRVFCSGEALQPALRTRFCAAWPQMELHNLYGPTEAAVDVTWFDCTSGGWPGMVPIGRPIANTRIYILDAHGQPVPQGVAGEIHIGGVQVARGYFNRPELTAERFIGDPFSDREGARLYKTGDLGRWLADGNVEYLGRNDFQVKIRGFRIELGEIEARLLACEGVRDAVVLAREDVPGDQRLVAYLLGEALAPAALRSQLSAHLADYMIPSAFVTLDAFPVTANGKLDRKALPAPDAGAVISRAYEAPHGETELAIAAIWQPLLGIEQVGRHDHFFELGGHSLMVVKVIEQLRKQGWNADVRSVFAAPSVAALAALLGAKGSGPRRAVAPPNLIRPDSTRITPDMLTLISLSQDDIDRVVARVPGGVANVQDIYPLAPLQTGMLFHHVLESDGDPYLMCAALGFDHRARLDAFLGALQQVIDRHDILRSAVMWADLATPVQVVFRAATLPVEELVFGGADGCLDQLMAHVDSRRLRLDLQRAPLLAAFIARDAASGEWLLALAYHHLVSDHVTLECMVAEVQAIMQGLGESLPAPVPYRNFIAHTLTVDASAHEQYFREQLSDIDEPTAPFGLLDVQGDGSQVEEAHAMLDDALALRIRESARRHGVTPAVVFHVAWAQVLGQCSGRDDVVFGTVLLGRMQGEEGSAQVMGMFVNTLPVRVSLAQATVAQAVDQAYRQLTDLLVHEQASLALAQGCSGVASQLPLFTTLLNYRHSNVKADAGPAWDGIRMFSGEERINYPIGVAVDDLNHGFAITAQCDGVDPQRIAAMLTKAVAGVVAALEQDPHAKLCTVDVLDAAERAQVVEGFNDTASDYPRDGLIHQVFEAQARARPQAVALESCDDDLTYDELNRRANQLARYLRARGVKPDERVAICAERNLDLVVGLLGILKAGAGYVPLDPAYPAERLAFMLEDSAPVVLLTQASMADGIAAHGVPVVVMDGALESALIGAQSERDLDAGELTARNLAYIIYTSGSTGKPKGTLVEHRNVLRLAVNGGFAPLGADDCIAHCASPSFDASTWEIWAALLNGARIVLVPQATLLDPAAFNRRLIETGVSALWLTAGLFNEYVDALEPAFARLRYLLVGGDALDPRTVARALGKAQPPAHFINGYGPTESTTFACTYEVTAVAPGARGVPIGRPIANTQVYVLDRGLRPAPIGVTGEIYIGGDGLARGYRNRPDLTDERFVASPFGGEGARLYKTGDLGRWLADGNLECLGRNDSQVKLRGFRIELGEIEARLAECEGVREARVIAREDAPGAKRLVAYLLTEDKEAFAPETLRTALLACLPDYMVPSAFVALDAYPLTANGKLDRAALPAPGMAAVAAGAYEAPLGATEATIARIWQELLGLDRIGRHDDFFELGGHSLMAVTLVGRLRQELGVEVSMRELFGHPTLGDFAEAAARAKAATLTQIVAADRSAPLPLSFAQQRLWFLDQLDHAAGAAYHMPAALRLKGQLDPHALQAALDRIVARHENLRTTFRSVDDATVQVIGAPEQGFALLHTDLRHLEEEEQQAAAAAIGDAEGCAPFDLATGPLVRGQLLRLGDDEHILLITQHHIVSDGWSIGVLVREVSALYAAFSAGQADPLPPLAIQYADFAAWQRAWLQGEVLARQVGFWKTHLEGAPALLELPADHPRPAVQGYAGRHVDFVLPPELTTALRALSARHGATLFMVMLAGWSALLARLSGQDDVVIGTPVANRQRTEVEALIGFFVNTLALRVSLAEGLTVAGLLEQVRSATLGAYEHQDLPFEQVVDALKPVRSMSYTPLFQVMLSMNNTPASGTTGLQGLVISTVEQAGNTTHFDLNLALSESDDVIVGRLDYACDLFEAATVERFAAAYAALLGQMAAGEQQLVSRLDLLGADGRAQVTTGFNDTACDFPRERTIHGMFEEQADAQPESLAVVYGDDSITYAELNRRANQVAHTLTGMGVKTGDRVALCVGRGVAMAIGWLGIMKCGAAYVPMEPDQPADRIAYMLADSGALCVLTTASTGLTAAVPVHDLDGPLFAAAAASDPAVPELGARDVAYVIYTSGSTGAAKGVMVEHRSAINFWQAMCRSTHEGCPQPAQIGLNASYAFDMSWKGWLQLLSGHCIHPVPQDIRADGAQMLDWLARHRIDVFDSTPSQLEVLLAAGLLEHPAYAPYSVLLGGEPIQAATWDRLKQSARTRFFNMYGPTECTVDATLGRILASDRKPHIGRPLANAQVYVLDGERQPVPVGVTGELYIGGAGVARGYLNRPELTADRFVADPFGADPQARLYRTGDLARWREDGNIDYLGRNDFQVKIRGYRIELGEIEARLLACEGVREAVVLARDLGAGDLRLVAYLTGAAVDAADLRRQLAQHLADYMLPAAFVHIERMPLNANGKLDRRALPAPDMGDMVTRQYEAPQGPLEQAVALIWQDLLQVQRVGRNDHFFDMGGHSLLAVRVVSRIRQEIGIEVALRELFAFPVLDAFAAQLGGAAASAVGAIPAADRSGPLPLSWAQQRLWFLDRLDAAAGAAYHMPAGLRLEGELDLPALKAALDRIVARHEILRTTFVMHDEQPVQRIGAADIGLAMQEHDLSPLCRENREANFERIKAEVFQGAFDLSQGPLIRAALVRLEAGVHVLLLCQHHIISDGWSLGVLVNEVGALYAAMRDGSPDPLAPLGIQYADYAAWQRAWLQGDALQEQVDFWTRHLAGAPALLALPTDRPRPAEQSYAGRSVSFMLDADVSAGLRQLSQRHGTTLFMTALAAWGVLLARMSGQDDVVIGTPIANRGRSETEALMGFFVNTLALRIRIADAPSVAALLAQVRRDTLDAYSHQDIPFDQVVDALKPVRSMSHSPLFQALLTFDNEAKGGGVSLPGLEIGSVEQTRTTTHFDLSLAMSEAGGIIGGSLTYASALFDEGSMERLADCFQVLLGAMVEDDSRSVAELPLLGAAQRAQVLEGFNACTVPAGEAQLIHQLFEQQVLAHPDAAALSFEGTSVSYAQLNRQANRLAHRLLSLGVKPDQRVAICVERGLDMVAGLLAILKAGAGYVPLDPAYPQERLAFTLADSAPVVLLTQAALAGSLPAHGVPVLVLDGAVEAGIVAAHSDANPDVAGLGAAHLAYVIYTSGSTGQPKGVMVEHRQVTRLLSSTDHWFGFGRGDVWTLFHSFAFDFSVWEIWGALLKGGRLVVVPYLTSRSPQDFYALLCSEGVTVLNQTPSAFRQLIAAQGEHGEAHQLRWVVFGGEALETASLQPWYRRPCNAATTLVNMYGITETTVHVTYRALTASDAQAGMGSPVGRPIPDLQVYILDALRQPVPVGVAGELYVGGAGVARGYLNRDALTAERFIPDPFGAQAGARLYKTGDIGRWLADGSIDYLGRNDFQVKIRGFRIELGEIEARLLDCDGVREAVVLAREDVPGDKRLVAYLVGAELAPAALRSQLAEHLADYMIPSAFVTLEGFPLTANGKLDRNALPRPDGSAIIVREYQAPSGATETAVARIWQELLGVDAVGRHDQFFELGGHSLMAVQLVARLRQELGVEVSLRDLFAHPALIDFAALVARGAAATMTAIAVADRNGPLPLSFAQQRLWFLDQLDSAAGAAYHMPLALRLKGALDKSALRAALDRIVARHESLRTSFVTVGGVAVQVIGDADQGFALAHADLRGMAGHEAAQADEARAPFNLATGPLIRGRLLRVGDDEHILLITQHHIISDGWSMGVLVREVSALYAAFSTLQADPLPPLAIQYADYAAWQRGWLQGEVLAQQTAFWSNHLAGAPALLEMPTDRPRPAVQSYAGGEVRFVLPGALTNSLRNLSRRHGTTLFMTMLAGWSSLLARMSGQHDIVIGTPVANRQRTEVEALIGFFVNTLALRVRLDDDPTVAELLAQVKASTLDAYQHQDLPFEQVVDALKPVRSMSYSPVFQSMLTMNNTPVAASGGLQGLDITPVGQAGGSTHFDLSLALTEHGDVIAGQLDYASDLFDPATMERLAERFSLLLCAMVTDEQQRVSRLNLVGSDERRRLLEQFNDSVLDFPEQALIHQLFEEQAARLPDAPALTFEGSTLTYAQLNQRANKLAHHLRTMGVQADDCVAVCLERGIDMVTGLLGILKAGAAYVPLDPAYPADRLAYMLGDCSPVALLTQHSLSHILPAHAVPVVLVDDAQLAAQSGANVPSQASAASLAYVIYTSGSTGMPKGVMIEHRNAVNFIAWAQQSFVREQLEQTLFSTSINFDL
ncbi:amino acid adenylation domain-containing protein, partial [Massilia atriviolacea]